MRQRRPSFLRPRRGLVRRARRGWYVVENATRGPNRCGSSPVHRRSLALDDPCSNLTTIGALVWRLVLDAYSLECIVDRMTADQPSVFRIVETGRELHIENMRSPDRLEALGRQYMARFQEVLRRTS